MTAEYTVVGAGAIGGTIAWHLAAAGRDVLLVDADEAHVEAINASGLIIERTSGEQMVQRVRAVHVDSFDGALGATLLAVKAQHTDQAAQWIAERLTAEGWVISLQNGLNEDTIAARVGRARTVGAFVNLNADVLRPGVVHDGGVGALVIGELDGSISERASSLAADLHTWAGSPVVSPNVQGYLWAKQAYGAMLTATSLGNEEMAPSVRAHRKVMIAVAREVCALADALELRVEPFDAFDVSAFVPSAALDTSDAAVEKLAGWLDTLDKRHSGIWRDLVVRKRPTEVGAQYDRVVEQARERGIGIPVLTQTLAMLAQIERGQRAVSDENLIELERTTASIGAAA